jgi:hypothetical protein
VAGVALPPSSDADQADLAVVGQAGVGQRGAQGGLALEQPGEPEQLVLDVVEDAVALRRAQRGVGGDGLDGLAQVGGAGPRRRDQVGEDLERQRGQLLPEQVLRQAPAGAGWTPGR